MASSSARGAGSWLRGGASVLTAIPAVVGQAAVDPVVEEPIRPLEPGQVGPSFGDELWPGASDLTGMRAARCGAIGPQMPTLLVLSFCALRWRATRD